MRGSGLHFDPAIDEIVNKIIERMLSNNWRVGTSHRELLAEYPDRSVAQIRDYAASASRFIRTCRGKDDEVRERVLQAIDQGIELAKNSECVVFDVKEGCFQTHIKPDLKALKDFLQFQAEIHGLLGTEPRRQKAESVEVPLDDLKKVLRDAGVEGVDSLTKKEPAHESASEGDDAGDDEASD